MSDLTALICSRDIFGIFKGHSRGALFTTWCRPGTPLWTYGQKEHTVNVLLAPHCSGAPAGCEGCLRYTYGDVLGFLCPFLNAVKREKPLGCHLQMTMAIRDALQ